MIENKFIQGILSEFKKDFEIDEKDETKSFEHLINYLVLTKIVPDAFNTLTDIEEVNVDSGSNFGIDGIAIIVNNNVLKSIEEIETYKKSRTLNVKIVFTQSKTSANYDSGDLYKFIGAVQNFFSDSAEIKLSDEVEYYKEIYNELLKHENARLFEKNSPECIMFYSTTSKTVPDDLCNGVASQGEKNILSNVNELKSCKIHLTGADYVIDTYNDIENRYEVIINFKNNLALDKIDKIEQSYLGYLTFPEFLKLITDNLGELRRNIFYENVRDFQGESNKVNQEISETISTDNLKDKFILFNNGITVVAKYLKALGSNDFEIRDFQIVNGCQTSNMLFLNKAELKDSTNFYIPIKLIHSLDNPTTTKIIKANNFQTPVPDEAFITLEKFHKRLQEFYLTESNNQPEKLYYERRSKEYQNSESRIDKSRIINLHSQIRAFSSIFLAFPQLVYNNNPTEILRQQGKNLFKDTHQFEPYYTSSYILFVLQKEMNKRNIPSNFGPFRYYIGLIYKILATGEFKNPWLNSKDMIPFCRKIMDTLNNKDKRKELFLQSIEILKKAIDAEKKKYKTEVSVKRIIRTNSFKDEVFNQLKRNK